MSRYYVCTEDAILHLQNTRYMFVSEYTVYKVNPSTKKLREVSRVSCSDDESMNNRILLRDLSEEEILFLTLSCDSIKIYTYKMLSARLKDKLQIDSSWTEI